MKKQIILPVLIALSCCYACEKSAGVQKVTVVQEHPSLRLIPPRSPVQPLVDSSGSIHNAVLETLYSNTGYYQDHAAFAHYLTTAANDKLARDYSFEPLPKSFIENGQADIVRLMSNNYYLLQKPQMDSIMNKAIDQLVTSPLINAREKNLFDQSRQIFNIDSSTPESTAFDSIIARAGRLLLIYNSRAWPEGEGHAVGGFLNIAKSSAQYWKSKQIEMQAAKMPPWIKGWGFPQFDAAGYIIGWSKAWLWDELETQKKRIGAGLTKAAEWSGISSWFK